MLITDSGLAMIRRTLASLALQLAVRTLVIAMHHASVDDRLAARAAIMTTIARSVGPVPGRGCWSISPIGLARAALASIASVAVGGAAAVGTIAAAVAMVTP